MSKWRVLAQEKWAGLNEREQRVLAIGAGLLTLFIVYEFIFSPLLNQAEKTRTEVRMNQKTLAWMQAADKQMLMLEHQHKSKKPASIVALLGLLQKKVIQAGFDSRLVQLRQIGTNSIEMRFQNVNFNELLKLLVTLVQEQPVLIARMTAAAGKGPGMASATTVLDLRGE